MLSSVYKSKKKEFLFIYVDHQRGLDPVPEDLLAHFGEAEWVLDVELDESRNLATEDPVIVMCNIRQQGYHLQLPPADLQEGR